MLIERERIEMNLAPWLDPKSDGKQRVDIDKDGFTIKYVSSVRAAVIV
jgi:hypothetical protein